VATGELDGIDQAILSAWRAGDAREVVILLARKYHAEDLLTEEDIQASIQHIEARIRISSKPDVLGYEYDDDRD